jgi:archaemetzincin
VILVPIGEFPDDLLGELSQRTKIPLGPARIDPSPAWNPARRQYESTRLLAELKAQYGGLVIGAADFDLFIPVLTFVFGEAEMPGRAAIFSVHRLRQEFYGLAPDPELLVERAVRELWHEVGHVGGLPHCYDSVCVMSPSHAVERVDSKSDQYCLTCMERLNGSTLSDALRCCAGR